MNQKVKVCFKCKKYVLIYPDNPENLELIRYFDLCHSEHPIQIINLIEIDNSYACIPKKEKV